ncbi:MAG: C39 family peptidase [Patescibacteria group bacterium]|nr:C39 family peptidase [Patescibacteria group bacterium]
MRIPHAHQINNYYCGPAILQMVLAAHGMRQTQKKLAKLAGTNSRIGTSTRGMIQALDSFNLEVASGNKKNLADIRQELAKGSIIIVAYTELHWQWGHYAIVLGYKGKNIHLLDPTERLGTVIVLPAKEFDKRWKDPMFTKTDHWAAFVSAPKSIQKK